MFLITNATQPVNKLGKAFTDNRYTIVIHSTGEWCINEPQTDLDTKLRQPAESAMVRPATSAVIRAAWKSELQIIEIERIVPYVKLSEHWSS